MTARIKRYPAIDSDTREATTHYAVFDNDRLIAFCHHESTAVLVRDDVNRRAGLLNESR